MAERILTWVKPYRGAVPPTKYAIGEYISVQPSIPARTFFCDMKHVLGKKYRSLCSQEEAQTHYDNLTEGCFQIVNVLHCMQRVFNDGQAIAYDKAIGIVYEILDENKNVEYIPENMAEFVY